MSKETLNQDTARLCPTCSSPSVDFSELANTPASCRICGWKGTREELYSVSFTHMQGTREGIAIDLFNDVRRLLGSQQFMLPFVTFLRRWGFISADEEKRVLVNKIARYGSAVARGMLTALISEREALEKQAHG